jgi:hypothetical protein
VVGQLHNQANVLCTCDAPARGMAGRCCDWLSRPVDRPLPAWIQQGQRADRTGGCLPGVAVSAAMPRRRAGTPALPQWQGVATSPGSESCTADNSNTAKQAQICAKAPTTPCHPTTKQPQSASWLAGWRAGGKRAGAEGRQRRAQEAGPRQPATSGVWASGPGVANEHLSQGCANQSAAAQLFASSTAADRKQSIPKLCVWHPHNQHFSPAN